MKGALKIEKVSRENVNELIRLVVELAHYEKLTPPDDAAKRRLEADALSKNPPFHAFVTYLGDRAVGFIIYYCTYSMNDGKRILFLEQIFVENDVRKKGLGKEMFNFCLEEAKKQSCCELQWSVLTWNENAIGFYERMGAKRDDVHIYCIEEKDF